MTPSVSSRYLLHSRSIAFETLRAANVEGILMMMHLKVSTVSLTM